MPTKKDKPKFLRPNYGRKSRARVKGNWRRQRGEDNKKRIGKAYMGKSPSIGYGQDKKIRGMHPVGKYEVLVHNTRELEAVKDEAVRIAGSVSKRLRTKLIELAKTKKLIVLNSKEKKEAAKKAAVSNSAPKKPAEAKG